MLGIISGGKEGGFYKSTDGGGTWTQTSLDAGQFSVDFDPGVAAVELLADPHRDRAGNPVHPQQEDVQRMAGVIELDAAIERIPMPERRVAWRKATRIRASSSSRPNGLVT